MLVDTAPSITGLVRGMRRPQMLSPHLKQHRLRYCRQLRGSQCLLHNPTQRKAWHALLEVVGMKHRRQFDLRLLLVAFEPA